MMLLPSTAPSRERPLTAAMPPSGWLRARTGSQSAALILLCALLGLPSIARADGDSDEGADEIPESTHPALDSPESVSAQRAKDYGQDRHKTQAFLIPLDERARAATARVAQGVEGQLAQVPRYEMIDLSRALAVDATPDELLRAGEGRRSIAAANELFVAHRYAQAVQKLREGTKQLERGLPALDPRELAEAYVRLGAAQARNGDAKGAGEAFTQAALFDPQGKVDAHAIDPAAEASFAAARADQEQSPTGMLEVDPRPGGARVFIDGQPEGQAPVRMEVAAGHHFVRIERAGFYPSAQLIAVAAQKETDHDPTLQATPDASLLNRLISGAAGEAGRGQVGPDTRKLVERFGLERALIGSVASHGNRVAVLLALIDAKESHMIAQQSLLLAADGTDADQVELETQDAVRKLVAHDNGGAAAKGAAEAAEGTRPAAAAEGAADAESGRRPVLPGQTAAASVPASDDDPGLVSPERKPARPTREADWRSNARADSDAPVKPPDAQKRKSKKKKGIFGKTGTEQWNDGGDGSGK